MFPNLDGMIELSGQIYDEMKVILDHWERNSTMIGPTMIKFSKFLMIYIDFFKNLPNTQQKLRTILMKSDKAKTIQRHLSTPNKIITI